MGNTFLREATATTFSPLFPFLIYFSFIFRFLVPQHITFFILFFYSRNGGGKGRRWRLTEEEMWKVANNKTEIVSKRSISWWVLRSRLFGLVRRSVHPSFFCPPVCPSFGRTWEICGETFWSCDSKQVWRRSDIRCVLANRSRTCLCSCLFNGVISCSWYYFFQIQHGDPIS